MSKLTLNNITSGYASHTAYNTNNDLIKAAIEKTLFRDGTSPNTMEVDLDMNGHALLNLTDLKIEGVSLVDSINAAASSAAAALVSKNNAASSETNAASSENAAASSAALIADWGYFQNWTTLTVYVVNNIVSTAGSCYICLVNHTSGTFGTDLSNNYWKVLAQKGDPGAGTGDMLVSDNLSELTATATTARGNISAAKSGANTDITSIVGNAATATTATNQLGGTADATTIVGGGYGLRVRAPAGDATPAILQFVNNAGTVQWGTITCSSGGFDNVGVPVGTIIDFSGTSAPTGYLACPLTATNISRTTYAALFAAIGTTWGAGNGSTTFGMPWFAADYAAVQTNANVGTNSTGAVIAHTHVETVSGGAGGTNQIAGFIGQNPTAANISTQPAGGAANLAAGVRVFKCVRI